MFVFFFKQKTAYEMRISDWSSDVCSSDLGWRIPFVIGALLALGVYLLRRGLAETPSFENQAATRPLSTAKLLWREHRRESILVGLLSAGGGIGAYTYLSYMQKYLFNSVGFDKATATNIIAVEIGRASCRAGVGQYV